MDGKVTSESLRERVRQGFSLFERDKKGKCFIMREDLRALIRYLGIYPTEEALNANIIPLFFEDIESTTLAYDIFEEKALNLLSSRIWEPDSEDILLYAFKSLDESSGGFIDASRMRELLLSRGEPFLDTELESFMSASRDQRDGRIYYEDYIAILQSRH